MRRKPPSILIAEFCDETTDDVKVNSNFRKGMEFSRAIPPAKMFASMITNSEDCADKECVVLNEVFST